MKRVTALYQTQTARVSVDQGQIRQPQYATRRSQIEVYWPVMRSEVVDYVFCKWCQLMKGDTTGATHPMVPTVVSEISELWSVDIKGPFLMGISRNQYIVIMPEHLSRWTDAATVPNQGR
ncbi:hypothetical protein T265_08070 [Opisthorchis viverrini]|uniref:Integrase zinc-binding domain-containing protein n=1 Tax=Opisthorchis viverrini TaxID=6198 RepID=A0A074ZLK1_OPIVI|nr:hypothetical protein T265_08070 [Opisthorchis viverrini]KER24225.1 hypothetical protein T265_08070 [Opisthorchis viverrini]